MIYQAVLQVTSSATRRSLKTTDGREGKVQPGQQVDGKGSQRGGSRCTRPHLGSFCFVTPWGRLFSLVSRNHLLRREAPASGEARHLGHAPGLNAKGSLIAITMKDKLWTEAGWEFPDHWTFQILGIV